MNSAELKTYGRDSLLGALGAFLMLVGDLCLSVIPASTGDSVLFMREAYLGGKKNFHNGAGGTYDCIAIMSYYDVCRSVTSFREIEEIEENLILPSFRKLQFAGCNKPFWRKLMYKAFTRAKSGCDRWHDYEMNVAPYNKDKPIYYEFTACPAAEFAKKHGMTDIMPALCNVDYASMELIHAKLVRTSTCADSCKCDYNIVGDRDQ